MNILHKDKAIELRRLGYSLAEISKLFNISKSTASLWTKYTVVSKEGIKRIREKAKKDMNKGHDILRKRKQIRIEVADLESDNLIRDINCNKNMSIIALSMIYWCEGNKNDNGVVFTNSDPNLVKAFIKMLSDVFNIDRNKLRVCIHIHDYHNEKEIINFWSIALDLPIANFTNSYKKKSNHLYKKEGYKGCAKVSYFDVRISRVILSFAKKFIKLYI